MKSPTSLESYKSEKKKALAELATINEERAKLIEVATSKIQQTSTASNHKLQKPIAPIERHPQLCQKYQNREQQYRLHQPKAYVHWIKSRRQREKYWWQWTRQSSLTPPLSPTNWNIISNSKPTPSWRQRPIKSKQRPSQIASSRSLNPQKQPSQLVTLSNTPDDLGQGTHGIGNKGL